MARKQTRKAKDILTPQAQAEMILARSKVALDSMLIGVEMAQRRADRCGHQIEFTTVGLDTASGSRAKVTARCSLCRQGGRIIGKASKEKETGTLKANPKPDLTGPVFVGQNDCPDAKAEPKRTKKDKPETRTTDELVAAYNGLTDEQKAKVLESLTA